jgi:sensor histidine kinase regulating citrate/malate metabolism
MSFIKNMKLRTKINLLVFLNVGFVLLLTVFASAYLIIDRKFQETGEQALMLAKTVASMPEIVRAFDSPNPSAVIQPLAESIRVKTGAQFIVVGNMNLIRYSHPNPEQLGKHMVGEDDEQVLKGRDSITEAIGTLGMSIRGKSPIWDGNHRQVGIVSVGFLVETIWKQLYGFLAEIVLIGLAALLFGLGGAYLLSGHIKKQILNMEPFEIAFKTQEQSAILESIREGIIAVNADGRIITCNREAQKILGMEPEEVIGKNIRFVLPNSRLPEVLEKGVPHKDQPMIIGNSLVVVNRVPVYLKNRVIGAVSTFRDKLQLDHIDQKLADIGQYVDSLRSQRHEFMNKLHLISGLIQMKEYDTAKEIIRETNEEYQHTLNFFLAHIRDSAIVGILIGKMHRAKELGIDLQVDADSVISSPCPYREIVITFLGNAVENAFEAIQSVRHPVNPSINVLLREESDRLTLRVSDTGPGVDPALGLSVFEDGVSTKGEGRGLGLAILSKLVANAGGKLRLTTSENGTTLEALLPKPNQGGESRD